MLESLRRRRNDEEEGFTLIELMVVVLIIAILLAIAIPTFLGARQRAQNRAAQSDIRNALAAEKVVYTDIEAYTENTTTLASIEPSLTYLGGSTGTTAAVGVNEVGTGTLAGEAVCISKVSESGDNFSLLDVATGQFAGTYYYTSLTCDGDTGADAPSSGQFVGKNGW